MKFNDYLLNESMKSELEKLNFDNLKRAGKLVILTWKNISMSADEMKQKLNDALKTFKDKIKIITAIKKGSGLEAEIEMI
jgi:hypothetical protein